MWHFQHHVISVNNIFVGSYSPVLSHVILLSNEIVQAIYIFPNLIDFHTFLLSQKKPLSKFKSLKGIWLDNIRNKNPTNVPLEHQTRSDAMQLYSIRSKQIVKVKEVREKAWEQPNYELTMTPKSRSRRGNELLACFGSKPPKSPCNFMKTKFFVNY